jgi:hypothetical protein
MARLPGKYYLVKEELGVVLEFSLIVNGVMCFYYHR